MTTIPRRFRRTLNKISRFPAVAVYMGGNGYQESDIHSIRIHHGMARRGGGYEPSTVEVSVKGLIDPSSNGSPLRVFLRDPFLEDLSTYIGPKANTPLLGRRYTGRTGTLRVDDTGKRYTTTATGSSWLTQMFYSTRSYTPVPLEDLTTVLLNLSDSGNPLRGINIIALNQTGIRVRDDEDRKPILWRDGIQKYGQDPGVALLERRDGHTLVAPIDFRTYKANQLAPTQIPLTRSQGVAPATWEQNNERPAKAIRYTVGAVNGTSTVVRQVELPNPTGELRETVDVDWSHLVIPAEVDNQLYREAYGRAWESSTRIYGLPVVKVDLLHLLGSDKQYHRDQAAVILGLDTGDPIYLAGDWHPYVAGVHFADEITETITPDSWEIELGLTPWSLVTGSPASSQPVINPRVWDSAGKTVWNDETRTWDQAA